MININQVVALRDPLNKQKYNKTLRAISRNANGLPVDYEKSAIVSDYRKNMLPLAIDDFELETGIRLSEPCNYVGELGGVTVSADIFYTNDKSPVLVLCKFSDRDEKNFIYSIDESSKNNEIVNAYSELLHDNHGAFVVYQWSCHSSLIEGVQTKSHDESDLKTIIDQAILDPKHKKELEKHVSNDELVSRYIAAKSKFDDAKKSLDDIKKEMIEIAGDEKTIFSDEVTCTPVIRQGSIDYKKMAHEHISDDVNREEYRGKEVNSWRFS